MPPRDPRAPTASTADDEWCVISRRDSDELVFEDETQADLSTTAFKSQRPSTKLHTVYERSRASTAALAMEASVEFVAVSVQALGHAMSVSTVERFVKASAIAFVLAYAGKYAISASEPTSATPAVK